MSFGVILYDEPLKIEDLVKITVECPCGEVLYDTVSRA
jgi:hypothetical protein